MPGYGVVFVVRHGAGDWSATWCDVGAVEVSGPRDEVIAWASAQPAAEQPLQLPEQLLQRPGHLERLGRGDGVDLDSARSRVALQRWTT